MFRFNVVLAAGLMAAAPLSAAPWADGMFSEQGKDFGLVPRGPTLTHYFLVTNKSDKPVHIAGAPEVDLFAATSGTDSDWVVKLIDVYPAELSAKPALAGYQLPIGIEIYRGRYVHGRATPAALTPGKVENYKFGLPNVNHVFEPGHRIMVQIQSSLFPLYDRNPQTWVDNIFNAKPGDYKPATQSIVHAPGQASAVWLPILP